MVTDDQLLQGFKRCKEIGALPQVPCGHCCVFLVAAAKPAPFGLQPMSSLLCTPNGGVIDALTSLIDSSCCKW